MARRYNRLTEATVRNAKPRIEKPVDASKFFRTDDLPKRGPRPKHTMLPDGGGLYCSITVSPDDPKVIRRSWIFRYSVPGEFVMSQWGKRRQVQRQIGLGSCRDVSLELARKKAQQLRLILLEGRDPLAVKRGEKAEASISNAKSLMTFSVAALCYIANHAADWSEGHARVWRQTITDYLNPVLGDVPCRAIDDALVIRALSPLFKSNYPTAKRTRGRGELILDWAGAHGHRQKDVPNPFRWRGHLAVLFGKHGNGCATVKHMPSLDWQAVPAFMAELGKVDSIAARALTWTILSTARTGSVLSAEWPEIDEKTRVWNIPADHMKRGVALRIPISPEALAVLRSLDRDSGTKVFPSITKDSMFYLLKRLDPTITVHGFRSSFSDFAIEHGWGRDEVNEALGHQVGNAVSRAYLRSDVLERRRALMAAWAAFCSGKADADNVVPLARGRG